ncbi:XRE family transcriptional regulator [Myceligenerans xiligouense]|uniref:XRE family transcriptional regulator n=1 Tax=Myceligenerans xiligouense TaxID=253184 RepID=UPI001476DF14|nr:XRE family transcriptional regulator [Myceligenerans xiligouense]
MTATAHRSGDWWAIEVPEVRGVHTRVKRLDQAAAMAADAVALMLETDPADIDVTVNPVLNEEAAAVVARALKAAQAARQAQEDASAAMRLAVTRLRDAEHLTARDVASLLGVSHQRVSQLAS